MIAVIVGNTRRDLVEAAYTLGVGDRGLIRRVLIPGAAPEIAEVLRTVLGWAWTYVIVAELIGASSGIGHMITDSQALLATDQIIFGIIVIGLIGLAERPAVQGSSTDALFPWAQLAMSPRPQGPPLPPDSRVEYERRIHRVMDHIERHLDQPLDLETLAAVANFSAFHFHRLFRAWTGETLGDHLRRLRVEKGALRLLTQPRLMRVAEVALAVGFGSGEAFARAFKSRFGATPSAWREDAQSRSGRGQALIRGWAQSRSGAGPARASIMSSPQLTRSRTRP